MLAVMKDHCNGTQARFIILLLIVFTLCGVIYLGYFCHEKVCALSVRNPTPDYPMIRRNLDDRPRGHADELSAHSDASLLYSGETRRLSHDLREPKLVFDDLASKEYVFDMNANDVIVFLHIQKTGGTSFGRHLVQDLDLKKPCDCKENRKRCRCTRPNNPNSFWLFSRYSTGWQCGLHADWTELTNCVDSVLNQREGRKVKRRYFYVTLLRDPVQRFLSEFLHVQRGATWKQARHWCAGREATAAELPPCFPDETWEDVQLEEFLSCASNLAFNRQTRMLADLALVGCYNTSAMSRQERDLVMLASAKENLRQMAFFGLCEHQQVSQYLFEQTFDLHFMTQFQQDNETHVAGVLRDITPEQLERVRALNRLDLELYEYARALLLHRFERSKTRDAEFAAHFNSLGRLHKPPQPFKWEDLEQE